MMDAQENAARLRVIYVDDDPSVRELLCAFLLDHGIDIHSCANSDEALLLLDSVQPHVVVLDLVMPGMDGFETARRIRNRDRANKVRLVALTGVVGPETLQRATAAGFDEFLKKPVTGRALLAALGSTDQV